MLVVRKVNHLINAKLRSIPELRYVQIKSKGEFKYDKFKS